MHSYSGEIMKITNKINKISGTLLFACGCAAASAAAQAATTYPVKPVLPAPLALKRQRVRSRTGTPS